MIKCPFCGEDDFDLIGLKGHFDAGNCEVFNSTQVPFRMFSRKNAQQDNVVDLQTANNTARDEIAALANELEDFNSRRVAPYGRITEIAAKMRQLSPVA